MKPIYIFLGANEKFGDNEEALSMKALEDSFYIAMNGIQAKYEKGNSSSMLSDPKQKMESIIGKVMECNLCILDITSIIENKEHAKFIETIYRACIQLDKKMILLHHFAYPIDDWVKIAKKENILQIVEHDGNRTSEELSSSLNTFFKDNQNKQSVIPLDDSTWFDIPNILNTWFVENEMRGYYLHIHFRDNQIEIDFQGYNTGTLFQLIIDLNHVSAENRKYVESMLKDYFQDTNNVWFTVIRIDNSKRIPITIATKLDNKFTI